MIRTGQNEVINFLKQHPKRWFTQSEISENLKVPANTCTLEKLVEKKLVVRQKVIEFIEVETIDGRVLKYPKIRYK